MTLPTALVMASLAFPLAAWAQAPLGIPRELALQRAALVSNLRYALHYTLTPHALSLIHI